MHGHRGRSKTASRCAGRPCPAAVHLGLPVRLRGTDGVAVLAAGWGSGRWGACPEWGRVGVEEARILVVRSCKGVVDLILLHDDVHGLACLVGAPSTLDDADLVACPQRLFHVTHLMPVRIFSLLENNAMLLLGLEKVAEVGVHLLL